MSTVTPGYTFTGTTDPITYAKLNLLSTPTVALSVAEVTTSNLDSNISISGLTITANTPFIGSASTETYSAAIAVTISTSKGNTRLITCTNGSNFTLTPSGAGTAGQHLYFIFLTNAAGSNMVTYASPFKTTGTQHLATASRYYTSHFVSDGTYWCEVSRTAALS